MNDDRKFTKISFIGFKRKLDKQSFHCYIPYKKVKFSETMSKEIISKQKQVVNLEKEMNSLILQQKQLQLNQIYQNEEFLQYEMKYENKLRHGSLQVSEIKYIKQQLYLLKSDYNQKIIKRMNEEMAINARLMQIETELHKLK